MCAFRPENFPPNAANATLILHGIIPATNIDCDRQTAVLKLVIEPAKTSQHLGSHSQSCFWRTSTHTQSSMKFNRTYQHKTVRYHFTQASPSRWPNAKVSCVLEPMPNSQPSFSNIWLFLKNLVIKIQALVCGQGATLSCVKISHPIKPQQYLKLLTVELHTQTMAMASLFPSRRPCS